MCGGKTVDWDGKVIDILLNVMPVVGLRNRTIHSNSRRCFVLMVEVSHRKDNCIC